MSSLCKYRKLFKGNNWYVGKLICILNVGQSLFLLIRLDPFYMYFEGDKTVYLWVRERERSRERERERERADRQRTLILDDKLLKEGKSLKSLIHSAGKQIDLSTSLGTYRVLIDLELRNIKSS